MTQHKFSMRRRQMPAARGVGAGAVAGGDGRYFAMLECKASRLNYRVGLPGYAASITQLNTGARQRSVTLMHGEQGATRAAFGMKLARRDATARAKPDMAAL